MREAGWRDGSGCEGGREGGREEERKRGRRDPETSGGEEAYYNADHRESGALPTHPQVKQREEQLRQVFARINQKAKAKAKTKEEQEASKAKEEPKEKDHKQEKEPARAAQRSFSPPNYVRVLS